ncbi:acetyl-CoA C-acyltransferase [Micromonospora sp. WMMD975]|uniref:acetyl-CoA C-acyltransferase n=1 Tax=Micromonospora sp. WMMD975 TaxID=3016087 RepID=UPI00249C614B|nr:acetyl-CoA C-acyltransferase [Micromonospora sp. WMMD975]WFE36449.1 acetyl-CoA C-acyltransferase [Micromonospora sp. WMMD975]
MAPAREAVIVATARTPIGRAYKGSLRQARPDDLAGFAIARALEQVPAVTPDQIGDVIVGTANPAGEQGLNIGRLAALLAGLPNTVTGTTVSRGCASSLDAIRIAANAIMVGEGDVYVAGGVESVSRTPSAHIDDAAMNPRFGVDPLPDAYITMGRTAENVAERFDISRARMDEYAKLSQDRAVAARDQGFFAREISPYPLADGTVVAQDDCPRANVDLDVLAGLPTPFRADGRVTAGNSCPLNDGAAAVVVMSAERARNLGIEPLARIMGFAVTGLAPEIMGVGPIEAVRRVLDRTGLAIGDVDVLELNEAFAAQVLAVADTLKISVADQLNPHGGAIALGHPFGMTGARIMTTLLNGLAATGGTVGVETMCVGGGQGMAMAVERLA